MDVGQCYTNNKKKCRDNFSNHRSHASFRIFTSPICVRRRKQVSVTVSARRYGRSSGMLEPPPVNSKAVEPLSLRAFEMPDNSAVDNPRFYETACKAPWVIIQKSRTFWFEIMRFGCCCFLGNAVHMEFCQPFAETSKFAENRFS